MMMKVMIKALISRLKESEFNRNAFILVLGSAVAQSVPVISYPVLTRLYSPDSFGVLGLFISIYAVLSVVITGKYELAVILPEKDNDAKHVLFLSVFLSVIFSIISFFPILFFGKYIAVSIFGVPEIEPWLYLVPAAAMFRGVYQAFNYWGNRKKKYKRLALSRLFQSSSVTGIQLAAGFLKAMTAGLVLGKLAGVMLSCIAIITQTIRHTRDFFSEFDKSTLKKVAKRYVNHPKHLVFSHLLGTINSQFANFAIARFFGASILGFYTLSYQLVVLPTVLIANNLGDVFRQEATDSYHKKGRFDDVLLSTLKKSFLMGVFPFLIFVFGAPALFGFFFGDEWRVAGEYSRILALFTFMGFVITPIDKASLIVGKTGYLVFLNVLRLGLNSLAAGITYLTDQSIEFYLWLIVAVNCSIYLLELIVSYRFSKYGDK